MNYIIKWLASLGVMLFAIFPALSQDKSLQRTELFCELPNTCPTPDSFTLTPDGTLLLTCPNYAVKGSKGKLVSIEERGEVKELGNFYLGDKEVNVRPMGIVHDKEGSIFMCGSISGEGMVFIVNLNNEKIELEVIARGLKGANGIKCLGESIFVTTPSLPNLKQAKNIGGLYRFDKADREVRINGDSSDANLIFTIETQNPDRQFGLDGIAINTKGQLFVGDFGDAIIYKLKIKNGKVGKNEVFAHLPKDTGIDGLSFGPDNMLYAAGFCKNEIWRVDKKGTIELLARNDDSTGADGELDQPADVFVYKDKLLISNFDLMVTKGMINSAHEAPHTISMIKLK